MKIHRVLKNVEFICLYFSGVFLHIQPENGSKCKRGKRKKGDKIVQRKGEPINVHVATFMRELADFELSVKM